MRIVATGAVRATSRCIREVHCVNMLFALELRLDALAVGRVADERQDGAYALDKESTLTWLGVVESGLDAVVAVRVA